MGSEDEDESCLLEFVVRTRRLSWVGKRARIWDLRSETGVDAGACRESVGGRPMPWKEVRRTFSVLPDIKNVVSAGSVDLGLV